MTLALRQSFHWLLTGGQYLARLLRNLVLLPLILIRLVRYVISNDGFDPDFDMLREHLLIPLVDEKDHPSDMTRIAPALDLAARRDWDGLLKVLKDWEARRVLAPTLSDLTTIALHEIAAQGVALNNGRKGPDGRDYLSAMQAAYASRVGDHMMAALLAMQHIKLGWHWRGGGLAEEISPAHEQRFFDHFEQAHQILMPFDAIELNAPSVALARFNLFACHPDAEQEIENWFYDLVDLTPDAISPMYEYGFQLLPQWFGEDEAAIDQAGLRAVAATSDRLGKAAYPALWLAAFDGICTDGVLGSLDVDLFYEGLDDYMALCSDPRRANSLTKSLYDLVFCQHCFDATTTAQDADERAIAHLRLGFAGFVRRHLNTLVVQMWPSADDARWYAAQAYRSELEAGAVIRVTDGAIQIDMPQPEQAPPPS